MNHRNNIVGKYINLHYEGFQCCAPALQLKVSDDYYDGSHACIIKGQRKEPPRVKNGITQVKHKPMHEL